MSVELRNAPTLAEPQGFSHISIADPGRVIHLAGQGGADGAGIVTGDLAAQTTKALLNLAEALDASGATPDDLVKITIYIVGWDESKLGDLLTGLAGAGDVRPLPLVPVTLIGVQSLFLDAMLVEVDAVAVVAPNGPAR